MESRDVDVPRVASGTSGSSGSRTRSRSDGSDFSGGSSGNYVCSSCGDCGDSTSIEEEADTNGVVDIHVNDAKVADIDDDDDHDSHGGDVGRPLEDSEGIGTGAGANAQNTAWKADQATEVAAMKKTTQLIRSVEINCTCCWDGVSRDQTVADARIVIVVDSKPATRLVLLSLDEEFVKTGRFYSIHQLSTMTGTVPIRKEMAVTPPQDSRLPDAGGGTRPDTRLKENNHPLGNCQRRKTDEQEVSQTTHDDETDLRNFKKRRLFPISRSAASKSAVAKSDNEVDHASPPPITLSKGGWPGAPAEVENPLWRSCEWVQSLGSLGKDSRSTSGHTVHIHSRKTSSSHSSARAGSGSPRTSEQLSSKQRRVYRALSHRHCEACKLRGHRLPSESPPGLQAATEDSNVKMDPGDKSYQSLHRICCEPYEQEGLLPKGLTIQSEKHDGSATKLNNSGLEKTDSNLDTYKSWAPYKRKPRGLERTKDFSCNSSLLDLKENSIEPLATVEQSDEAPRLAGHEHCMKPIHSYGDRRSFGGQMENIKLNNVGQSQRTSSFSLALQDKSCSPVNMRSPNQPGFQTQRQTRRKSSSLFSDKSLDIWMPKEGANSVFSHFEGPGHFSHESHPTLNSDDGKLVIYFPDSVASGTYLIEIEASISLSAPDTSGWQGFLIPGLLPLQYIEVPIRIKFHVQSTLPLPPTQSGKSRSIRSPDCSWIAEAQFNADRLFDVEISTSTEISGKFRLGTSLILQLRLKIPIYELDHWDTLTSLRTFPRWSERQGLQIEHHASLSMVDSVQEIFAEQVKYSFLVKNGFRNAIEHMLKPGECLMKLGNIDWQDASTEHYVEVTVIRHLEDLGKPLELSFALCYPKKDQLTIRLPTLSPKTGTVMSERVMLVKPPPPLMFEYPESDSFSTWRRVDLPGKQSQNTCFDRNDLPRFFPEGLKDDLVIRIVELAPVCFRALRCEGNPLISEEPSNLVWNLKMIIDKAFGGGLECHMKFNTLAGSSDQVLTVNPNDWSPDLFIIGGQLATQAIGEWRKDRNGNLILFKLPDMSVGQGVEIALRWYKMIVREKLRSDDPKQPKLEHFLPNIVDKSVLGGSLRCNVDAAVHISRNGKSRDAPQHLSNKPSEISLRLPKLYLGYTIGLSLAGVPNQPTRSIRFKDEQSKPACADPMENEKRESSFDKQAAIGQLTPGCILHPDRHISSAFKLRSREKIRSWARHFYNLTWSLLRCAFTPFLLICAFQFAVSRITHAWRPVDATCFSSVKARHDPISGLRSILNLGSLVMPRPQLKSEDRTTPSADVSVTEEFLSGSMAEHPLDPERVDGMENETTIEGQEDPGHGEPTAEGMSVMDWIDRALGWKNITH